MPFLPTEISPFRPSTPRRTLMMGTTGAMPSPPASVTECYPIEFHCLKALFLQGQYRRCIQASHDVLNAAQRSFDERPLQDTFVSFYLGLCHDAIARSTHVNSVAKLPGLDTAEQFYQAAINAIPSADDARFLCRKQPKHTHTDPFFDGDVGAADQPSGLVERFDRRSLGASSPDLSQFRKEEEEELHPAIDSPRASASDVDDLESHESFSELMTPNRVQRDVSKMSLLDGVGKPLPRDVSKMSLIDSDPYQRLPRDPAKMSLFESAPRLRKSTSQGLMRPIRPGSPPKRYHIPPKLPSPGTSVHLASRLPALASRSKTTPQLGASEALPPEPVSPLSQLGSTMHLDEASTVSALSSDTPRADLQASAVAAVSRATTFDEAAYFRFTDHLSDLREQLETHVTLVQEAKRRLKRAQAEKDAARSATPGSNAVGGTSPAEDTDPPQAPASWSFVPQDVKHAQKKRRIQEGRARGWKKERFDAGRYRELCETAMAEL